MSWSGSHLWKAAYLPQPLQTAQPMYSPRKTSSSTAPVGRAVGSSVDFPNLDPFFHNVFSLFNGKRFDLGLYEGHSHRSVQFDREGVSYIFCNIHPDMGAVVVALNTPYYAVSTDNGTLTLHDVPRGRYRLNVWAENAPVERLNALSRIVEVGLNAQTSARSASRPAATR